jgi:hypothetical protein
MYHLDRVWVEMEGQLVRTGVNDDDGDDDVYLDKLQTRGLKNLSSTCEM